MKIEHVWRRVRPFLRGNKGVSALEYAILAGVVVTAAGAGIAAFSGQMK